MRRRIITALLTATVALGTMGAAASSRSAGVEAAAKDYANCTKLNKDFPHGVGKPYAVDKTSGRKVTNFKRSLALYNANSESDRDNDGIACEKL